MSGIAGAIDTNRQVSRELLERMAESLHHSDRARVDVWNEGPVGLCRVHLEVTNPEPEPFFNADRTKALVLFGHLFRDQARQKQLESSGGAFKLDGNDAEYAMRVYSESGDAGLTELNGSFCFAIADNVSGELKLVSDRFSSRPLYYALTPQGSLVFGTQVSTVLCSDAVGRLVDERSMLELFNFQRVFGTRTLNRSVSVLPPGSVLRYRNGEISIEAYWEMDYRPERASEHEFVEGMAHAVGQCADRVTRGGERFGVLLSGGLDSRMVLSACKGDLRCYHFNDTKNHEWFKAQELADIRGCPLTYLERSKNHYTDLYESSLAIGSGMHSFNYAHTIGLMERVRDECDFVLHGFAPELYFRGTNLPHVNRMLFGKRYLIDIDWTLTPQSLPDKMIQKLKYSLAFQDPSQVFREPYRSHMAEALRTSVDEIIDEAGRHSDDLYDQFLWPDTFYHSKFPSFVLESSIRPFVGERSLVFDNDVLDLHLRMPVVQRSNSRIWIRAVRELNPQIAAVPDANTGYSPFMSTPVRVALNFSSWFMKETGLRKPKPRLPGHATNSWPLFQEIIRHHEKLQALIERTINDPECLDPEVFDVPRVNEMFREHLDNRSDYRHLLFMAITFGGWNKRFGPGSPSTSSGGVQGRA